MIVGIVEPVDPSLRGLLRRAVVELRRAERPRGWFPARIHAGVPGGTATTFDPSAAGPLDLALRTDVLEAMLRRLGRPARSPAAPLVWLTRTGPAPAEEADLAWLAAARAAADELDLDLHFVVVRRRSWADPVTGVGQRWTRPPRIRADPAPTRP